VDPPPELTRTSARIARAERVAVLIDGSAYFSALRACILAAQRSLMILGWDVDSRVRLSDDDTPADGYPARLLDFLLAVLEAKPTLHVYISAWDFSVIYALEREFLPSHKFAGAHPRLHYKLQAHHPAGASHHEKLVVVDEQLAFVGGIDLTIRRWDTPDHRAHEPGRVDPFGHAYAPIHDSQLCLDGPAAAALAELARARIVRGGAQPLPRSRPERELWPPGVTADFRDVDVTIARTVASLSDDQPDVKEALAMTLAAIEAARDFIFVESQYLTSAKVVEALERSLREERGPELAVVLPREECGWLERNVMGLLRADALQALAAHDHHGRFRAYYPSVPGLDGQCVNVHSKLIIVDDRLLKIGSSNLSNRSLGLDTECDIWIEAAAGDAASREAIAHTLARLLGEHLGCGSQAVRAQLASTPSLLQTIEALRGGPRSLEPIPAGARLDRSSFHRLVLDPEQPPAADAFVHYLMPSDPKRPRRRALLAALGMLLALVCCGLLLALGNDPDSSARLALDGLLERVRDERLGFVYVLLAYVLGTLVFAPITVLLVATSLALRPWPAFIFGMSGALLSACLAYALGRWAGSGLLRRLGGRRLSRVREQVTARSFQAVLLARLLPVGNFTLINLFMGSLPVPFRAYLFGNVVGLMPGILGLTVCADQLERAMRSPTLFSVARLLLVLLAFSASMFGLSRLLARRQTAAPPLAPRQQARGSSAR
jgi:phospholipase D1/2